MKYDILIVGGGSSGWMTASTLLKEFPNKNIGLIESPEISTVGVGESTIAPIQAWTNYIGIDHREFLKHTDGSYKLSIHFTDFYKKGEGFHYPFGVPHITENLTGLNDWYFKKLIHPETPRTDYADSLYPQMALVNQNKCFYNEDNKLPTFDFKDGVAFHFDATKFGLWLRDHYCLPRGLIHIKERIIDIKQSELGIKSLNGKHEAELYIDCTGFSSVLLGKTLKVPFESYSDMLPNNSAWATKLPYNNKREQLVPYTDCKAVENGWIWSIPLWSRLGTGYVYSDKFIDDDGALKQFKKHLGTDELEFKKIKMKIGIHEKLWEDNVVAIGLAAGFIEPLESNGLFTVHEFLKGLILILKEDKISQFKKDNFTFRSKLMFRNFAEFVALHYALSQRTDTEYWKSNFNKRWDEKLINLKKDVNTQGFLQAVESKHVVHSFRGGGGIDCIAAGMHYDPMELSECKWEWQQTKLELAKKWKPFITKMNERKENWKKSVEGAPKLYDFLEQEVYK